MPNAVSNQCGPVLIGSMEEEQTVADVTGVEVADKVYNLPRTYSKATQGINFELAPNYSRKLEDVSVVCEEDDFFNDDFSVDSSVYENGNLSLKFSVNSEVKEPVLWSNGSINFAYDAQTKAWSMTAEHSLGEWRFCKSGAAIDAMVSALECFAGLDNDEGLKTIKSILVDNRAALMANVHLYRDDCTVYNESPAENNPLGTYVPY